jgi:hypothetical protein
MSLAQYSAQYLQLASANGVYNSSQTPSTLPWNTYNFCNAPHVNAAHYEYPPNATNSTSTGGSVLVHVSAIMRHHKVRACPPFPPKFVIHLARKHSARRTTLRQWSATSIPRQGGPAPMPPYNSRTISAVRQSRMTPRRLTVTRLHPPSGPDHAMLDSSHPVDSLMPRSTERCARPSVRVMLAVWFRTGGTTQQDLWELYHDHLGFVRAVDPTEIWVRTSTEDRTMQVAGAMLAAMDPLVAGLLWPVYTQPASVRPRSRPPLNNSPHHPD